jgi:plasmid stability protein
MASITSSNLHCEPKQHVRMRAAQHGRSIEHEARDVRRLALAEERTAPQDLAMAIRRLFARFGESSCRLRGVSCCTSRWTSTCDHPRRERAPGDDAARAGFDTRGVAFGTSGEQPVHDHCDPGRERLLRMEAEGSSVPIRS